MRSNLGRSFRSDGWKLIPPGIKKTGAGPKTRSFPFLLPQTAARPPLQHAPALLGSGRPLLRTLARSMRRLAVAHAREQRRLLLMACTKWSPATSGLRQPRGAAAPLQGRVALAADF